MVADRRKKVAQKLAKLLQPKPARLRYSSDAAAGIRRVKKGKSFDYFDANHRRIRDPSVLARIRSLAIPPAWTDVWICSDPRGHLQATGSDARGRKQYRYHPQWRELRDRNKYDRLLQVAAVLPRLRRKVQSDLRRHDLSRPCVLATVVQALETTLIRVGNEEYARTNRSYGLTTLHNGHARVNGSEVRFSFRGKSGKHHVVKCNDATLAQIVKRCQELPGRELFGYLDQRGRAHDITSTDVNDYLHAVTGEDITAKDFRTWAGTLLAAKELAKLANSTASQPTRRMVAKVVENVAQQLGNTKAICQKCYIHPKVLETFLDGSFIKLFRRTNGGVRNAGLRADERALLQLLKATATKRRRHHSQN